MASDLEARQQIVQIVNELYRDGHLTATGGNVSSLSNDGETVWITPSGLFKGTLAEDSLVRIRAHCDGLWDLQPALRTDQHRCRRAGRYRDDSLVDAGLE